MTLLAKGVLREPVTYSLSGVTDCDISYLDGLNFTCSKHVWEMYAGGNNTQLNNSYSARTG